MRQNKYTSEKNTETRKELAERYFGSLTAIGEQIGNDIYGDTNMGIISLLSDLQHHIVCGFNKDESEHYRVILNDIKCVLVQDDDARKNNYAVVANNVELVVYEHLDEAMGAWKVYNKEYNSKANVRIKETNSIPTTQVRINDEKQMIANNRIS